MIGAPDHRRLVVVRVAILVVAALGAAVVLLVTPHGIGVTPDSVMYLGMARGLLKNHASAMTAADGWFSPVITYMPGISVCYALPMMSGLPLMTAAKLVGVLLFAVTIVLVGTIVTVETASGLLGVCAALLMTLNPPTVLVYAHAWSEPVFVPLVLAAVWLTAQALDRARRPSLVLAGVLLGLAYLSRYAAVAFIGASGLALLIGSRRSLIHRLVDAATLGGSAAVFMLGWMIRNARLKTDSTIGRTMQFHGLSPGTALRAARTLGEWFVPPDASAKYVITAVVVALMIGGAATLLAAQIANIRSTSKPERSQLPLVCAIAILCYIVLLLLTMLCFDPMVRFDSRICMPLLMLVIVGLLTLASRRKSIIAAIGLSAAALAFYLPTDWRFVEAARKNGLDYAASAIMESPTLRAARKLPLNRVLYSNCWDVLYLVANRHSLLVYSPNPTSAEHQDAEINGKWLRSELRDRHAILVMLNNNPRSGVASIKQLQRAMPVRAMKKFSDGGFYVWDNRAGASTRPSTTSAACY